MPTSALLHPEAEVDPEKHIPNQDLEAGRPESADQVKDPNIVWWDGPDDPENPRNWSTAAKFTNVAFVSLMCFITPVASAMFAPGVEGVMRDFKSNNELLASFVVSVFVLGFGVGPMILAPLSEIYGRLYIYYVMNVLFLIFTIACAVSSNLGMLVGFRFLAGVAGSAPLANGGGTITDLIVQEKRGAAMAFFAIGPLLGPIIGPVAGGYLAQAKGWRWVFWLIAIISGAYTIFAFFFMRETYGKIILQKKTDKLIKATGNKSLKSALNDGHTPLDHIKHAVVRPAKLLFLSPIVLCLSIFQGICFGCLYLLFTTFSSVFSQQYGWNTGTDGLSFMGMGIGSLLSLLVFGGLSDRILKQKAGSGGELKPEYRLFPMIPATIFISAGLFWYGWSVQAKNHWIVPILGTVFVGFGYMPVVMCIQTYLVDAYEQYSASALAASTILRSFMGALIPLAGRSMYAALGYGWGNSLLAFITLVMLPFPWLFYQYGEGLRKRFVVEL
ncbi:multidrug resistance protein [Tricladium varicosporioides]|nr:multidrug resistance protein [Hymenoscyphus varicosporioides]